MTKKSAAAGYIAAQLAVFGYEVQRQRFQTVHFQDHGSILEVIVSTGAADSWSSDQGRALLYSPPGVVKGRVIAAGSGQPEDLPATGFQGGVALFRRGGGMSFREKVR